MSASDTKVLDLTPRNQYTASSNQTKFDFDFLIFDSDDLNVYQNESSLSEGSDYSVSGVGQENGGSITLNTGASSGDLITIVRDTIIERVTDYIQSGEFRSETINEELDLHTMMLQELQTQIGRALTLKTEAEIDSVTLPDPSAGATIGWNQAEDDLINVQGAAYAESVSLSANTPETINHGLEQKEVAVQFYDSNDEKAELDRVKQVDADNVEVEATVSVSGTVIVSV